MIRLAGFVGLSLRGALIGMKALGSASLPLFLGFAPLVGARPAMGADCQGRIVSGTGLSGRAAYDPFAPADLAETHRIVIGNTGAEPCAFGLRLRSRGVRPLLGGALAYDMAANGASLLAGGPTADAPLARPGAPLAAGASDSFEIQLAIPRGQFAAPDVYRDTMDVELYALDAAGRPAGSPLHATSLAIAYTVPRVLSVNLRGGETATTLGFGALATGQQRGVTIEARSNQTYQLDVTSDNRGALALTPAIPGQSWSVPYTATLAGLPLGLADSGASIRSQPPTRPESDASYPLTITIGEVSSQRSGHYADVITVEIKAALP